jgi:hypothetical protein
VCLLLLQLIVVAVIMVDVIEVYSTRAVIKSELKGEVLTESD